ncbi:MAG TPA: hypothetical protein DIC42_05355 [Holosporales bacterium]|nr:hypothetical protein [Holosporales bacterium]
MSALYKKNINIKKIFFFGSSLITIFSSAYGTIPKENQPFSTPQKIVSDSQDRFSGMFFGLHTGFTHLLAQNNYIQTNRNPLAEPGSGGIETIGSNGGLIGIHTVLGQVYDDNLYLGGEITANYYLLKGVTRNETYFEKSVTYQFKDNYTAAVRIGVHAGNALVYIKSGVALTHRTVTSAYPGNEDVQTYIARGYKKGVLAGFGVEIPLDKNISLGLEADYTDYKNDNVFHRNAANYSINASTYNVKFKITFKI